MNSLQIEIANTNMFGFIYIAIWFAGYVSEFVMILRKILAVRLHSFISFRLHIACVLVCARIILWNGLSTDGNATAHHFLTNGNPYQHTANSADVSGVFANHLFVFFSAAVKIKSTQYWITIFEFTIENSYEWNEIDLLICALNLMHFNAKSFLISDFYWMEIGEEFFFHTANVAWMKK